MLVKTDHQAHLEGILTVEEVPAVYQQSLEWKTSELPSSIDLSRLEKTDSSAVALLLEWQSWAHTQNKVIKFLNPPDSLRTIAGLSQVDSLLGWTAKE